MKRMTGAIGMSRFSIALFVIDARRPEPAPNRTAMSAAGQPDNEIAHSMAITDRVNAGAGMPARASPGSA